MSDKPTIQIDSDWKKQAQEEKRKLAEQAEKEARAKTPPATRAGARPAGGNQPAARPVPEASFAAIIQGMMTQALYYLGELAGTEDRPVLSLDMAKYHIDCFNILEEKTAGNLSPVEKQLLDNTTYDLRSRFISIARQMIQ